MGACIGRAEVGLAQSRQQDAAGAAISKDKKKAWGVITALILHTGMNTQPGNTCKKLINEL